MDVNTDAKLHRPFIAPRYSNVTPRSIKDVNVEDDLSLSVTNESNMDETDAMDIEGNNEGTPKDFKPYKSRPTPTPYENLHVLGSVVGTKRQGGSQQELYSKRKPKPIPRAILIQEGTPRIQALPHEVQPLSHDQQAPPADMQDPNLASATRHATRKESRMIIPDTEIWPPSGWTLPPQKPMPTMRSSAVQYENMGVIPRVLLDAILKFRQRKSNTLEPPDRDHVSSRQTGPGMTETDGTTLDDDDIQETRHFSMETSLQGSVRNIMQLLDQDIGYDMTDVSFDSVEDDGVDIREPGTDTRIRSRVCSVREIKDTLDPTAHEMEKDAFGADDESTYIVCSMLHILDTAVCSGLQTADAKSGLRHTSSTHHVLDVLDSPVEECDPNASTDTDSGMEGSNDYEYPTSDKDDVRLMEYRPAKRGNTGRRHCHTPADNRVEAPDMCNERPGSTEVDSHTLNGYVPMGTLSDTMSTPDDRRVETPDMYNDPPGSTEIASVTLDGYVPMGTLTDAMSGPITGNHQAEYSTDSSREMCDVPLCSETDRHEHDTRMSHVPQQQTSPLSHKSQPAYPTRACAVHAVRQTSKSVAQTTSCEIAPSLSEDEHPWDDGDRYWHFDFFFTFSSFLWQRLLPTASNKYFSSTYVSGAPKYTTLDR